MTELHELRLALAAWLRWHAPSVTERERAPAACRPLLDAMSRASTAWTVARLADEVEDAARRETAPPIPVCARCRHKATMHVADDEERRECMEWSCACEQFESEDA
jgi:hypothetical protein